MGYAFVTPVLYKSRYFMVITPHIVLVTSYGVYYSFTELWSNLYSKRKYLKYLFAVLSCVCVVTVFGNVYAHFYYINQKKIDYTNYYHNVFLELDKVDIGDESTAFVCFYYALYPSYHHFYKLQNRWPKNIFVFTLCSQGLTDAVVKLSFDSISKIEMNSGELYVCKIDSDDFFHRYDNIYLFGAYDSYVQDKISQFLLSYETYNTTPIIDIPNYFLYKLSL
jgi:hypothetical protein